MSEWEPEGETPVQWEGEDLAFNPGEMDIDPILIGRVDLLPEPGALFAEIYTEPGSYFDRELVSLQGIEDLLGLRDAADDWLYNTIPMDEFFDTESPDIRGPFLDRDQVEAFMLETGLWWADVIYDEEHDEYWIDVGGSP